MAQTKRSSYETLRIQMENEISSFKPHWKDISDFVLPTRSRFSVSETNKGDRRNLKIIDATATLASRTLCSNMMANVTSPARPWFKLSVPNKEVAEIASVKYWLQVVNERMHSVFLRSNLYQNLPTVYKDVGNFATACMYMEEDFDSVVRFYNFPVGSYMLANDAKLRTRVFFREFRYTVRQVVEKFAVKGADGKPDWSNISDLVKNQWEKGHTETWVDICHVIRPNDEYDDKKLDSKYKRFISVYYEKGSSASSAPNYITETYDKLLSEKGYDFFPILAPRWDVTGEDVYGTDCPGMTALGDTKALQTMQKRKAQAIEKMVNPPMTGPTSLRNSKTSILPGDITYADLREGQQGFRPVHEVDPRIQELLLDIESHQRRIARAYYEDIFLMVSQLDRREITATEIDERREEKLLALGEVLERLNQDLLDPLIDNTFSIMIAQSLDANGNFIPGAIIPEPPEELGDAELKVEYISVMAQAQKLAGIGNIERFTNFAVNLSVTSQRPEVLDKVNLDNIIDGYGDRTGIDVDMLRTDEEAKEIRVARVEAQEEAAEMEQMAQGAEVLNKGAKGIKELSQIGGK